jgi:hypothetical protein
MIHIESNATKIIVDLGHEPKATRRASVRAMNRAVKSANALMARLIGADMGLKSSDVKHGLRVWEANVNSPSAGLAAKLKRVPLTTFGAKQFKAGVRYKLGSRGTRTLAGGFMATVGGGHVGVFKRVGKTRLPIKQRFGPSIGHVFAKFRPEAKAQILEVFEKNLGHELSFARKEGGNA